jgi:CheY-like chemotaxis protein
MVDDVPTGRNGTRRLARQPPSKRPRRDVLVVEDEALIRDELADILRYEGYTVITAENGREGLEKLEQYDVQVLVLDLMLPVMSGWELFTAVRARPELAALPVLTITAVSNAHRAPGGPLFLKPLNVDSLVRAVAAYAGRES